MPRPGLTAETRRLFLQAAAIVLAAVGTSVLFNQFRSQPLAWDWRPPPPAAPHFSEVSNLKEKMARPSTVLVDAREPLFHRFGRLPGAVSLPEAETGPADLAVWRSALPPDAEIIIYCQDELCPMADRLAVRMMETGLFPLVFSPGFDGWEAAGEPTESGP